MKNKITPALAEETTTFVQYFFPKDYTERAFSLLVANMETMSERLADTHPETQWSQKIELWDYESGIYKVQLSDIYEVQAFTQYLLNTPELEPFMEQAPEEEVDFENLDRDFSDFKVTWATGRLMVVPA